MNMQKYKINRVSDVTIIFWVIKILSTTIGETTADFLKHKFGIQSVIALGTFLGFMIFVQMRFKRYIPWMYWSVIVSVAIFGTMFSDFIAKLGVPLIIITSIFLSILLMVFFVWYKTEKSLDMHEITTFRRETFYWLIIFFTFALGTAAGDLVSDGMRFGYVDATIIFGITMVIIPLILYIFKVNKIALFWISYILTRPFGAAGGDLLSHSLKRGGFGFGTGTTSLTISAIMLILIIYLTLKHKPVKYYQAK